MSLRQRQQLATQNSTTTTNTAAAQQPPPPYNTRSTTNLAAAHNTSDMKRSAVKELIERYFYQLQRGCGNPKCLNLNCASSGKVPTMTANEIAAKAIQLFSQDAKLCEFYAQQPPKVPRTGPQHESPTSSRSASSNTPIISDNMDTFSPQDHSTSSSTSNSTITSGSSSSSSTGSSNTNISSCATEELPLLEALGETPNNQAVKPSTSKTKSSDPPTPTLASVDYLNEQILDELIEECIKFNSYDRLIHAINQVYCSVKKLGKSFKRPPLAKLTSTATASKLQEILGKSPQELKKEDLRTLEGEHDKDEDCTCIDDDDEDGDDDANVVEDDDEEVEAMNDDHAESLTSITAVVSGDVIEPMDEDAISDDLDDIVEWSHSCDTQVDFESLRRVKKKLYALNNNAVAEALNNNIILLAESIKYGRYHDWEQVLHCFVICFDMSTTCK